MLTADYQEFPNRPYRR